MISLIIYHILSESVHSPSVRDANPRFGRIFNFNSLWWRQLSAYKVERDCTIINLPLSRTINFNELQLQLNGEVAFTMFVVQKRDGVGQTKNKPNFLLLGVVIEEIRNICASQMFSHLTYTYSFVAMGAENLGDEMQPKFEPP